MGLVIRGELFTQLLATASARDTAPVPRARLRITYAGAIESWLYGSARGGWAFAS